jgi:aerobic C4-dicarboxylate transport protein
MSEARALTNLVGNAVATLVVARWTGDLDMAQLHARLDNQDWQETGEPEVLLGARTVRMGAEGRPGA